MVNFDADLNMHVSGFIDIAPMRTTLKCCFKAKQFIA